MSLHNRQFHHNIFVRASSGALLAATFLASNVQAQDRYRIRLLDGLEGGAATPSSINTFGWVSGTSNRDAATSRATLWRGNAATRDLGTLGGLNSAILWPVKNLRGIIVGIAQTDEDDPHDEIWSCGYFFPEATATGKRCLGFKWQDGRMQALPTLGGTHGFATAANNLGNVVGWAETSVQDPSCTAPQKFQFIAVRWDSHDRPHRLEPLPGDSTSAATAINDLGQVVGISGACSNAVGGLSARKNVLWDAHGTATDIGDFGGIAWNTPMMINNLGDIVGFANVARTTANDPRAFVKLRGQAIRNLGTLPGDVRSQGLSINIFRQVVGTSCDASTPRICKAYVWKNDVMRDLNMLVLSGLGARLTSANDIDDLGRITGTALLPNGDTKAFVATPAW